MFEIVDKFLNNIPEALIAAILAGLLRNIAGWLENVYKDGKVEEYEIKQLLGTLIKYFAFILIIMLGLPIEQATMWAFVLDIGQSAIKNKNKESKPQTIESVSEESKAM